MICPVCSADTRVAETRRLDAKQYRLRRCLGGHELVTLESVTSMSVTQFRRMSNLNRIQKEAT